jgi:hypothetical protein
MVGPTVEPTAVLWAALKVLATADPWVGSSAA